MNRILARSVWLYEKLLLLYPADLRREFGSEMTLIFAEDLQSAWGDARIAGVLQIWWYALRELVTVALPAQRSNPCVLVPALAFAFVVMGQGAGLCFLLSQVTRLETSLLFDAIRLVVLLPSLLTACVAFIVTRVYARSSIAALRLD
jgi:hypothetical protein